MAITVSNKGWVVIPAELRRKYNLTPGTKVEVIDYGGVLSLVPVPGDPVRQMSGMLAGKTSLTQALLDDHREELDREQD